MNIPIMKREIILPAVEGTIYNNSHCGKIYIPCEGPLVCNNSALNLHAGKIIY